MSPLLWRLGGFGCGDTCSPAGVAGRRRRTQSAGPGVIWPRRGRVRSEDGEAGGGWPWSSWPRFGARGGGRGWGGGGKGVFRAVGARGEGERGRGGSGGGGGVSCRLAGRRGRRGPWRRWLRCAGGEDRRGRERRGGWRGRGRASGDRR